jgi:hypothetical protein
MAPNIDLTDETICDLSGKPLDRRAAALLKSLDKLLTVGSYYAADHDQYRVVSEKTCAQMVTAIRPDRAMAIEITAAGMMIRSQLVDPQHRNVRLLHDLLVPLNIARLEISADLSPADLRQAISALQSHKLNLGNTEGFQEIKIENLPPTVSTASRNVVQGQGNQIADPAPSLDELLGSATGGSATAGDDPELTDSEKLAQEFMAVVGRILENLEKNQPATADSPGSAVPDSSPEKLRALRQALYHLVEVKPDPGHLARLIEHSKKALDLSQDPRSVNLVFSMLKSELDLGGSAQPGEKAAGNKKNPVVENEMSVGQLRDWIGILKKESGPPPEPRATARANFLGICFHLLATDQSGAQQETVAGNLRKAISKSGLTLQETNLCCDAVTNLVHDNDVRALDRVLTAFAAPLRAFEPDYLVRFWLRLWESLDPDQRALVWPYLISDLLLGLKNTSAAVSEKIWLAAGTLDAKKVISQVGRLNQTPALGEKLACPALLALPLSAMYPVHLALLKSSQGEDHGKRLHRHLRNHPPNDLTEILMKILGPYDSQYHPLYLSLIKHSTGDSITPILRRQATRMICKALKDLPRKSRGQEWVVDAIGWLTRLEPEIALPVMNQIRTQKRFFFAKAWPPRCRKAAGVVVEAAGAAADDEEGR